MLKTGNIYKISSPNTKMVYIGSTFKDINERFDEHKANFKTNKKYVTSFEILKYDDCKIELLDSIKCNSTRDLLKLESEYCRRYSNICVNRHRPLKIG